MRLNKRLRQMFLYIGVVGVLALLVVVTVGMLLPKVMGLQAKYLQMQEGKDLLSRVQNKIGILSRVDDNLLVEQNKAIERAVPTNRNPLEAVRAIRAVGEQNGLLVDSLNVAPGEIVASSAATLAEGNKIVFSVGLLGDMKQILSFAEQIEKIYPLLVVDGMIFDGDDEVGAATLLIGGYFLPSSVDLGPIDAELPGLSVDEEKLLESIQALERVGGESDVESEASGEIRDKESDPFKSGE